MGSSAASCEACFRPLPPRAPSEVERGSCAHCGHVFAAPTGDVVTAAHTPSSKRESMRVRARVGGGALLPALVLVVLAIAGAAFMLLRS